MSKDKSLFRQMEYLLPNSELIQNYKKLRQVQCVVLGAAIVFFIIYTVAVFILKNPVLNFICSTVNFIIIISNSIASSRIENLVKRQYYELQQKPIENQLHLKLHEIRKQFLRRCNILSVCFVVLLIFGFIGTAILISLISKNPIIEIFISMLIFSFAVFFISYFISHKKFRLKMIPIENEIDEGQEDSAQAV